LVTTIEAVEVADEIKDEKEKQKKRVKAGF
jgi:hypothetical protein